MPAPEKQSDVGWFPVNFHLLRELLLRPTGAKRSVDTGVLSELAGDYYLDFIKSDPISRRSRSNSARSTHWPMSASSAWCPLIQAVSLDCEAHGSSFLPC